MSSFRQLHAALIPSSNFVSLTLNSAPTRVQARGGGGGGAHYGPLGQCYVYFHLVAQIQKLGQGF